MTMKLLFGVVIACAMVTLTLCQDIYIYPTLASAAGTLSCASSCPQHAPCQAPASFLINAACDLYIGNGGWVNPLVIQATGAVKPRIFSWDSTGTGDYIRNLKLDFTGDASTELRLDSWNATGTTLNVSCNSFTIFNSSFILDNVEPFNIVGIGTTPLLDISRTFLVKNSGQSSIISVGPQYAFDILIRDSNITMARVGIFSGSVSVISIERSSLNAYTLITEALTAMLIVHSHLVGFQASLALNPPGSLTTANSTFTGLSKAEIFPFFQSTATMNSFETTDCSFRWVQFVNPPQRLTTAVAIRNTFHYCRVSFELVSPNTPNPFLFANNIFVRDVPSDPALELTTMQGAETIYLSGNQFQNLYTERGIDTCSVSLGNFVISSDSDLVTDGLCVAYTQFDGSLEASFIDVVPASLGYINTTGNVKLSSYTSNAWLTFSKNRLHYSITNASQGIDAPLDDMPLSLHLSWEDSNNPLVVGDSWPVFTKVYPYQNSIIPTILSSDGSFTFNLSSTCTAVHSVPCVVNFTIMSFSCPCNPQNSLPCGHQYVYPCTCIAPWTGPTCDINSSSPPTSNQTSNPTSQYCPTPQPSPEFQCQNGTWTSNTSITQDTLNIPSNSGTIVVNGNLTITQTVIFQGLGSLINVTGCIFVDGDVVVELTDHDIEEIRKGSKTFVLMSSVDGNDCESSNDLSLIPINVKTPDKCVKVDAVNSGTKQSLSAIFTISQSKCSSSHLVAIIVPSVVGGVIILSAVAIIVILKIRHDKMHH